MAKQNGTLPGPLSRRKFLKTTAGVSGGAFLGS
ncbi:MAG: twin-arginine translocation signal domain-containing protein, partial [Chloroflexi bacterium]|nr:twin-arginine translocation signal domain-containing protein [Chloroflexota bacterium]